MAEAATKRLAQEGANAASPDNRAKPPAAAKPESAASRRKRTVVPPEARRAAILAAALEEFTARGYEGARLDDVAKRAGVAKGTIYLYFADKEALFQELVRSMVNPVLGALQAVSASTSRRACWSRADRDLRARDLRHAAQGHDPADPERRPALSGDRRVLLSRGDRAHARDHPSAAAARGRARRDSGRRARALPAADRRARPGRHHVERAVRQIRAARRRRDDARACRHFVRREERDDERLRRASSLLFGALALGACDNENGRLQGWVEAEFVFVGPDEAGRVETLQVREGDTVAAGAPLFALDAELQSPTRTWRRAVAEARARLARLDARSSARRRSRCWRRRRRAPKQPRSRPPSSSASRRCAKGIARRRNSTSRRRIPIATRPRWKKCAGRSRRGMASREEDIAAARQSLAAARRGGRARPSSRGASSPPGRRHGAAGLLPARRDGAGGTAGASSILPPGNIKVRFFVAQALLPKIALGDAGRGRRCDGCAARSPPRSASSRGRPNTRRR